ncbi:hypothetical protein HLRTI_002606 [Halorhabdus tiamatea SARL4B]|uniref:Uncharacterized protein n=1 Tax=Halorhabdus tiamatea SARL4B TaxID=1033806 RepID=U2F4Z4_9EURY|nr:hypothetical protein HLRTI_002606 [Halorhabdus tiamatea SARL4B]
MRLELIVPSCRCAYGTHTPTTFNTIATISSNDVRSNPRKRSVSQYGRHSPQPAACSFSRSRGSRLRRVSTRPACRERRRQSLGSCRTRRRAFDTIRCQSDALARITWPHTDYPSGAGEHGIVAYLRPALARLPAKASEGFEIRDTVVLFVPMLDEQALYALSERKSLANIPVALSAATPSPGVSVGVLPSGARQGSGGGFWPPPGEGRRTLNPEVAGSISAGATAVPRGDTHRGRHSTGAIIVIVRR